MPRKLHFLEPEEVNFVISNGEKNSLHLAYATTNPAKLKETRRIMKGYEIVSVPVEVPEIQSLDPIKVITQKSKDAWKKNDYNPIIVEDVSLEILSLGSRPGPYIKDFVEPAMRQMITSKWVDKDRRAIFRMVLGIYDGKEVHIREGSIAGTIAPEPRGSNGFGFDDIFIPDGQTGKPRTYAEMDDEEKDRLSARRIALERLVKEPVKINHSILMLHEPYRQELERVNWDKLRQEKALRFAYTLECLGKENKQDNSFEAKKYSPISSEENMFYTKYTVNSETKSLGLILTDVDRNNLIMYKNGTPFIWQMGPERRQLALAERADFFLKNQNKAVYSTLDDLEKNIAKFPRRNAKRSKVVERYLGLKADNIVTQAVALKEFGYKKISSMKNVSRTKIAATGLHNMIGKYPRSIFGVGSMPPVSGWRDVIVTAAMNYSPIFTTRNSTFAGSVDKQIALIRSAKEAISSLGFGGKNLMRIERNIGAAIGSGNIEEEMSTVKKLYDEAEVRLFRIYTINSDPRVIEISRCIRKEYGDEVEIFVGQITDKKQALELISDDIRADGLIFGHGGGRQCTSATNGMAITTLEEIYSVTSDHRFNNTSILVEGGVGTQVGAILMLGVDGILYNQQLTRCVIETGDIYFQHKSGRICQPYHGSASATTMIIESANPEMRSKRVSDSGRALNVEGKPGYTYYSEKANSMAFYLNEFKAYAARTLADLGVENFVEFRNFVNNHKEDLLRIVTEEAAYTASPYGSE